MKFKYKDMLFSVLFFIVLFSFFYVAHPLILFNSDDWWMCSYFRRPLPIPGGYNGIKVLPETLYPILSQIAANFVYPVMKDYLMSLAFVFALTGALVITMYSRLFVLLFRTVVGEKDDIKSNLIAICFLSFHFLIFKNNWSSNEHLFRSPDVTCFFHYVISGVLNASMVLWFMHKEYREGSLDEIKPIGIKDGFLVLMIYFAIFSNMFMNIIFISYVMVELAGGIIRFAKEKQPLKNLFTSRWYYCTAFVMWFFALIIQMLDPRNADAKKQIADKVGMIDIIKSLFGTAASINKMCLLLILVIICLFVVRRIKNDKSFVKTSESALLVKIAVSGLLTVAYLVLLSAVSGINYAVRSDVSLGYFFYMFLFFIIIFGLSLKPADGKESVFAIVLPLITFVIFAQTINSCKSYCDYNDFDLSKEQTYAVGQDIINQYLDADASGKDSMELHVMTCEQRDNTWPYTFYVGDAISDTLFRHGVISKQIKTTVVYDPEKNAEFHVDF